MRQATEVLFVCVFAAGLLGPAAGAAITLEGDLATSGVPIGLTDDVILGAPPEITIRTTAGGSSGAAIYIAGTTNDDVAMTTAANFDAGSVGDVTLQDVGNLNPPQSVTIVSAHRVSLQNLVAGAITVNAGGGIVLNGNLQTMAGGITLQGNVTLGAPAIVRLDTVFVVFNQGFPITITGTVDDDVAGTSGLVINAGMNSNVNLQGAVGGAVPIASLTVLSANQANLPAVTTAGGAVSVTSKAATLNGPMATGGGNVTLNAGTVNLNAPINTGGGILTGAASTVNLAGSGSLQNAVDVAAPGATLHIAGATYNESVTVATALTMDFLDTTTIGQALAIQNNVGLSGLAKYLAVDALAISGEVKLDVGSLPVYVDGDVETTLDDWIGDGRLLSSVWGPGIDATYNATFGRTEVTPEPATLALLALGGLGALLRRRRK